MNNKQPLVYPKSMRAAHNMLNAQYAQSTAPLPWLSSIHAWGPFLALYTLLIASSALHAIQRRTCFVETNYSKFVTKISETENQDGKSQARICAYRCITNLKILQQKRDQACIITGILGATALVLLLKINKKRSVGLGTTTLDKFVCATLVFLFMATIRLEICHKKLSSFKKQSTRRHPKDQFIYLEELPLSSADIAQIKFLFGLYLKSDQDNLFNGRCTPFNKLLQEILSNYSS